MIRTVVEPMRWDNYARQHNLVIYISYQLRHQHLSTRSRFVNHQSSFRTEASRTSKPSPCIDTKGTCASHHRSLLCYRRTHAPPHKYKVRYPNAADRTCTSGRRRGGLGFWRLRLRLFRCDAIFRQPETLLGGNAALFKASHAFEAPAAHHGLVLVPRRT